MDRGTSVEIILRSPGVSKRGYIIPQTLDIADNPNLNIKIQASS